MPATRCAYCGKELERTAEKCSNCGARVQPPESSGPTEYTGPPPHQVAGPLDQQPPPVGSRVLGRWGDGLWYPGAVDSENGLSRHVTFDDNDKAWLGPQDLTLKTDAASDAGGTLRNNVRVQGQWADGKWYTGVINDRFGRVWHVKFDDGDRAWLDSSRIRLEGKSKLKVLLITAFILILLGVAAVLVWANSTLEAEEAASAAPTIVTLSSLPAPPAVGTRVLAPFESGRYYFAGSVAAVRADGLVDVAFLDGDRRTVPLATLRVDTIATGVTVTARSAALGDGWWAGVVRQRNGNTVQIAFNRGTVDWVNLAQVRVQVME